MERKENEGLMFAQELSNDELCEVNGGHMANLRAIGTIAVGGQIFDLYVDPCTGKRYRSACPHSYPFTQNVGRPYGCCGPHHGHGHRGWRGCC